MMLNLEEAVYGKIEDKKYEKNYMTRCKEVIPVVEVQDADTPSPKKEVELDEEDLHDI